MQKKLIALAVAGFAAAPAFAQSNVTVYGEVNMAYQSLSGTYQNAGAYVVGSAAAQTIKSVANADSRIGFKGEENLGNGLKASFVLEYGINPDQNATNATANGAGTTGLETNARQTFLGVGGSWGTVTVGRQYTPFFDAAKAIDPFGAATGNVAAAGRLHPITAIARANNSAKYVGVFPAAGGNIVVAGLVGLSERTTTAAGTDDNGKMVNWKLAYAAGPLLVGVTGIKMYDNVAGLSIAAANAAAGIAATDATTKATAIGGTYDFKVAKLHLLHDRVKVTSNDVVAPTIGDRSDWMVGVTVPMGAHTVKVSYNKVNDKGVSFGGAAATNNDANQWGLGYNYAMSKRTNLFANYSRISNKNGASFGIGGTTSGVGTLGLSGGTERTKGLQLGMAHSF